MEAQGDSYAFYEKRYLGLSYNNFIAIIVLSVIILIGIPSVYFCCIKGDKKGVKDEEDTPPENKYENSEEEYEDEEDEAGEDEMSHSMQMTPAVIRENSEP